MPARPATIEERGRAKAYRPLPEPERRAAFAAAVAAYDRGDAFLAHELLEPAWMGASDTAERALHSGLIKLAAAVVHAARGNPAGVVKNLDGARLRLADAGPGAAAFGIDLTALRAAIDRAEAAVAAGEPLPTVALVRTGPPDRAGTPDR